LTYAKRTGILCLQMTKQYLQHLERHEATDAIDMPTNLAVEQAAKVVNPNDAAHLSNPTLAAAEYASFDDVHTGCSSHYFTGATRWLDPID